ncbi:NAD(P)H-binding protein [Aridibaculum aurantiacum]|uniref:NAD(P)H-binding protein n=1 Tax=Aridibaculum aurantiacum TaxID=2810307 RepID=UPI001F602011|nr:NAD(P)H-binding protein [Aridibaculum aurantiacum]
MALTAVVLGATGLIGQQVVQQLIADNGYEKVRLLVRQPIDIMHKKIEVVVVDFNNLDDYRQKLGNGDCIFCCIGTTQSKVKGDKAAYRKIDFDIPVHAAHFGKQAGFHTYALVSSVGADVASSNFYLRLKGEVEEAITKNGFEALHIFRPSLLLGQRKEKRLGEGIGKLIYPAIGFFFVGKWRKYKAIQSADVARAMVAAAARSESGIHIYHYDEILAVGRS